ncbi:MAG: hypothetical protein ACPF9M_09215 [Candidatus Puniceispirillaceae bacterium]
MTSDALKQLSALGYDLKSDQPRLALGSHGRRLLTELIAAARGEMWVSVIILSATLADVAVHETGQFDVASDAFDGDGFDDGEGPFGLSYLSAGERRRLEVLRARRNALVHYEGPVAGLSGAGDDAAVLKTNAEQAIGALLPVLENLERWG